jgi:hypothetical protein
MTAMKTLLLALILTIPVNAQTLEIHGHIKARVEATDGMRKCIVTRKATNHPVVLTATLLDANGHTIHTSTDRMDTRAEVAWDDRVEVSRIILTAKENSRVLHALWRVVRWSVGLTLRLFLNGRGEPY